MHHNMVINEGVEVQVHTIFNSTLEADKGSHASAT